MHCNVAPTLILSPVVHLGVRALLTAAVCAGKRVLPSSALTSLETSAHSTQQPPPSNRQPCHPCPNQASMSCLHNKNPSFDNGHLFRAHISWAMSSITCAPNLSGTRFSVLISSNFQLSPMLSCHWKQKCSKFTHRVLVLKSMFQAPTFVIGTIRMSVSQHHTQFHPLVNIPGINWFPKLKSFFFK